MKTCVVGAGGGCGIGGVAVAEVSVLNSEAEAS